MKIQNSQGEEISRKEVERMPVPKAAAEEMAALEAAETSEEILAAMPDSPICGSCHKKAADVDDDGKCRVCAPQPSIAEKARAEVAEKLATAPRPSLEVEMEVHQHLKPRIVAHVGRMRAWDLRAATIEQRAAMSGALDAMVSAQARLEDALISLQSSGFVAKTTPNTRLAAKLVVGTRVDLREDQRQLFSAIYSDEQLGSLSVVRATETHVQLIADDGSNIGLVKFIHVAPKQDASDR